MRFHDVDIEASDFQAERRPDRTWPARFKVRVFASPAGEQSPAEAAVVAYDMRDMDRLVQRLDRRQLDLPALIQFGRGLAALLLPPGGTTALKSALALLGESLDQLPDGDRLRLRLRLPPELAALPWEYLYIDRSASADSVLGFLALDPRVAIVRHEAMTLPKALARPKGDVKVLVALASAVGLPELDLDTEEQVVRQALDGRPGIAADILRDATIEQVQARIQGVGVFHFAGHGRYSEAPGAGGAVIGQGELAFDDQRVDAAQLAVNLRGQGVRIAMLAGCETARRDGVGVWSGIAPVMARSEIPAVVGHQLSILDRCAIAFNERFYGALAGGLSVEEAVTAGRIAIYNADPKGRDWGVPVLYLRAADGVLFEGAAKAEVRTKAREAALSEVTIRARDVLAGGSLTGLLGRPDALLSPVSFSVRIDVGNVAGKVVGADFTGDTTGGTT